MSPVLRPISGQDQGAFMSLWSWNGLWPAIRLSLVTGLAATLIGLAMTAALFALFQGHRIFRVFLRLVAPFLAVPHATAALALTFILAPSGWIMRGVVTLFNALGIPISQTPPDFITINDPGGLALIFGLVIKEVPFLVLMCVAAWAQCDAPRRRLVASALGYGRITGFWLTIWPVLYPQLRLPIFAVLAYSMTTVDMAMILGPSLPPSLAVQISKWITLPEPLYQGMAAAAAVVQLTLVAATLLVWRFLELMGRAISRAQFQSGIRGLSLDGPIKFFGLVFGLVGFGVLIFGLLALGIWSIAGFWPYPDVLPQTYTPRVWAEAQSGVIKATQNTVILALLSTVTAVFLVLAVLQSEFLGKRTYRITTYHICTALSTTNHLFTRPLSADAYGGHFGTNSNGGLRPFHLCFTLCGLDHGPSLSGLGYQIRDGCLCDGRLSQKNLLAGAVAHAVASHFNFFRCWYCYFGCTIFAKPTYRCGSD